MAGRDITDGRSTRAIAVDVGVVASTSLWQNTAEAYDVAVGGQPFIYAINDQRPYLRQTAPFRKDQFDNGREPGEQSLTGWWIRSQSSFHNGSGITFYDPTSGENIPYRFKESRGVDVWTKGQVTLLKDVTTSAHPITGAIKTNGRHNQQMRSIKWNTSSGVLVLDEYDIDKIDTSGTVTHFVDYNSGVDDPVYAMCDDGTYAYWVTNDTVSGKIELNKKLLTLDSTTAPTVMFTSPGITVTNAAMEFVKERIVMAANNSIYEISPSASSLPTALYTHPSTNYLFTSITASGPAIYVSGYNGIQSSIFKFTLSSTGTMPTLSSAIISAELPVGEIVHKIFYYLGYMAIGTNKGVRIATVSETDGSLTYGPLIVQTSQPVYDFAARDHFIWAASGVEAEGQLEPGVIRIDLGAEIEPLRFAWANDLDYEGTYGFYTTSCAFMDGTNRLAFCTTKTGSTNGNIFIENESILRTSGYIETGNIRYSTLEPKHFKRLIARGDYTYGSMSLETVDADGNEYDHITYDSAVHNVEVTTNSPSTSQEYISYKFVLYRDAIDTTKGPTFKGYQAKATIATPRQRMLKFPVYCFDIETDRYNVVIGYEGRAHDRLLALEDAEATGDVVTWQDLSTGESRQCVIEQITFIRATPPDKRFDGMGGIIEITLRTV